MIRDPERNFESLWKVFHKDSKFLSGSRIMIGDLNLGAQAPLSLVFEWKIAGSLMIQGEN
jgi:hypothetical protein